MTDSGQTAVGTQMVYAWIDADGLVKSDEHSRDGRPVEILEFVRW
jgi:hypothetical protein